MSFFRSFCYMVRTISYINNSFRIVDRPCCNAFTALGADHIDEERDLCKHRFGDLVANTEVHITPN